MEPAGSVAPLPSSMRGVAGVAGAVPQGHGVLSSGHNIGGHDDGVWRRPVRHFCESAYSSNPHQPEYFSAFSSLLITVAPLLVLFSGRHHNALAKFCAAALAWCGVGSFGFHWTLSEGWSFLDTFPMTLSAGLGLYMAWLVAAGLCTPLRQTQR